MKAFDGSSAEWLILGSVASGCAFALLVWMALRRAGAADARARLAPRLRARLGAAGDVAAGFAPATMLQRWDLQLDQAGLSTHLRVRDYLGLRLLCVVLAGAGLAFAGAHLSRHDDVLEVFAAGFRGALGGAIGAWLLPGLWVRDRIAMRRRRMDRDLPFFLDLLTLCVEGGLNLQGALEQVVLKGPRGPLHAEFRRMLRDLQRGKIRSDALRELAERAGSPSVTSFTTALINAERYGMGVGSVLRAQAEQRRAERFLRAERLAMEAPVKMLAPLITLIFPCTFIVIFVPIAMEFVRNGL